MHAGLREVEMKALEQPNIFGAERQVGPFRMQDVKPCKKLEIQSNRVVMSGEPWRHFTLHRLQRRRRFGCTQVVEQQLDLRQHAARAIERRRCVRKRGRFGVVRDRIDFRVVLTHRRFQRGREMCRQHAIERRQLVRRFEALQQGIVGMGHVQVSGNGRILLHPV